MSIKATVTRVKVGPIPFPKLMISDEGQIVLMTEASCGTNVNGKVHPIGFYAENWSPCFRDFDGSVILQNE